MACILWYWLVHHDAPVQESMHDGLPYFSLIWFTNFQFCACDGKPALSKTSIPDLIVSLTKGTCRHEAQEAQFSWASGSRSWHFMLDSIANGHVACGMGFSIMMLLCRKACMMDCLIFSLIRFTHFQFCVCDGKLALSKTSRPWIFLNSLATWHVSYELGLSIMMLLCRKECMMDSVLDNENLLCPKHEVQE